MDYPYVRAWGKLMGSFDWAIDEEVQTAISQKAPANAVARLITDGDGNIIPERNRNQWSTTDDILNHVIRLKFVAECERLGIPHPWNDQPF